MGPDNENQSCENLHDTSAIIDGRVGSAHDRYVLGATWFAVTETTIPLAREYKCYKLRSPCSSGTRKKNKSEEEEEKKKRASSHDCRQNNLGRKLGHMQFGIDVYVYRERNMDRVCVGGELFARIVEREYYSKRKAAYLAKAILDCCLKGENFTDVVGNPQYIAPEVLNKDYSTEADICSASVMVYMLLSASAPFWGGMIVTLITASIFGSDKTSDEPLSIEAYAARYKGRTKIIRLLFIAKHLDQESCQIQALKMPYYEIKKG
ncbi:unnamed protein product [Brassica oleracea var. botrytis]